ncbi:MAG: copper chaperone PCu(A)C [Gammaproteobacteria bacterium]
MKLRLCLAVLLWACALPARADLLLEDAWIAAAPPGATAHAAYAQLRNTGTRKRVCTAASSPDFGAAEIHRSLIEDGRHRMLRAQQIEIAPGQTAALAPGGLHLMLFRPARPLAPGESARITLDCGGTAVSAPFFVRVRP